MATRGNRRFDVARPRARERRRRQDLPRRRDRVSIAGEEKQRAAQLTQIDEAAERAGRRPADIRRMYNINGEFGSGAGFLQASPRSGPSSSPR